MIYLIYYISTRSFQAIFLLNVAYLYINIFFFYCLLVCVLKSFIFPIFSECLYSKLELINIDTISK